MPALSPTAKVGHAVARARANAKLTQLELAHLIGLAGADAGSAISRIENDAQQPRLTTLIKIAEVLHVPVTSLLPV